MKHGNYKQGSRYRQLYVIAPLIILLTIGLYLLSTVNYLLYHSLVELLAAVVAITIFSIGWNTRKYSQNSMLVVLATGYLIVGIIDILHTLSFKGMGVFPLHDANLPTQFWIAARYVEAGTILLGSLILASKYKPRAEAWLTGFLITGIVLVASIFYGYFPDCFVGGQGLTPFKVASEYLISAVFVVAGIILWKKRTYLGSDTLKLLLLAFGLTIMSEMSFTLYVDVYGFFNFLGHIFKFFSIALIYKALINDSLQQPYYLLFREVVTAKADLEQDITDRKQAEQTLRESEAKYRQLIETLQEGIWVIDKDGYTTFANQVMADIVGYTVEEMLGKHLFEFIDEEQAKETEQYVIRRMQGIRERHESKLIHKDGHHVVIELETGPIFDEEGNYNGAIAGVQDITARKQAEEDLKRVLNEYETVFQGTQDAMCLVHVIDKNTFRFIRNNKAHIQATGLTPEFLGGKTPQELMGDEIGESINTNYRRCVNAAAPVSYEETLDLPGGEKTWYTTLTPIFQQNKVSYMVGSSQDITERKRVEQALRESQERLQAVFQAAENVSLIVTDVNPKHPRILEFSPGAERIFGYKKDEILGKNVSILHTPEVSAKFPDVINDMRKQQKGISGETTLVRKSGEHFPALFTTYPLFDSEGNMWATLGVSIDITERKHAEEALQKQRDDYQTITNLTGDIIVQVDKEGRWTFLNDLACSFWGESREKLLGQLFSDYLHSDDHEETSALIVKMAGQADTIKDLINRQRTPQGWRIVQWNGAPFYREGEYMGFQATGRDITAQKEAEQKLADYTLELEQLYHQLDEEINKARIVHERTLPTKLPDIPGISFAPHYQPAQKMGGDFYDIIQKDNKLIFYLSDVSGHGLDGAMLSVFVKHTIKNYISYTPADKLTPAATLHHLAEQFGKEDYPEDLYVCLFVAVLDLTSMELTYCSAGLQEALLVQLGNGERMTLHSKGLFITSYLPLEILKLQEGSITLTPGSTIFCNTDGLTEQGIGGTYYRDKLPDVFFQNAHQPAHLVAQAVVEDFRQFNKGSIQGNDDITFLVLKLEEETPKLG